MTTPESKVKTKLDAMLKQEGVWYFSPQAGPHGKAGIPDRIAIVGGWFVGIECKADKSKKPTKLQERCGLDIMKAGGLWFLVYDTDTIEQLRGFIHASRRASQGVGAKAK
jgi:hypothetical protein